MTSRIANRLGALALAVADAIERAAGNLPGGANAGAALVAICNHPNENIRVLQGALGLTHSGVVRLLDGLEGAGFVERRRGVAEDGRAAAVIPTKKGRRRAQDILSPSFSTRGVGDPGKGSRTTSWSKGLPHRSDVLVLSQQLSPGADARRRLGRQGELELFEQQFVISLRASVAA